MMNAFRRIRRVTKGSVLLPIVVGVGMILCGLLFLLSLSVGGFFLLQGIVLALSAGWIWGNLLHYSTIAASWGLPSYTRLVGIGCEIGGHGYSSS